MKKTVKINIGGVIFHLDDDAYALLQNYLTAINQRFASTNEGKEIISDIEHRIAEILQGKLSETKQVISKDDIEEVIDIMGHPEDFENVEDGEEKTYTRYEHTSKRLYRDPDNRVLGGVCSGIATYLNIDPLIIRILFLVLLFAYGIIGIIYIVLWALLPAAYTTAQKLEMRGERFNISDIEKNVRKEYENVKDNLKNMKNSKDYERAQGFFDSLFSAIGAIFRFLFKFIGAVIGLALIVAGVGFLIGLTGTLIIGEPFMPWNNFIINDHFIIPEMLNSLADPNTLWIIAVCAFLVVVIPLFAIIYGGFKLLLGIRPHDRSIAGFGFLIWLVSFITLIVLIGLQVRNFSYSVEDEERIKIDDAVGNIYYLKATEVKSIERSEFYIFDEEFHVMYDEENEDRLYAYPEVDIVHGHFDDLVIEIIKEGRGSGRVEALNHAKAIDYSVVHKDSIILFDAVYTLLEKNNWKFPEVDINIKVPEGCVLYIDESMEELLDYVSRKKYYRKDEMVDKYWIMTEDGLVKVEKDQAK
jgi:phage shock protein PspC (stress-responsive transcriptional regulator)